ncbi:uncharacterized protein LOC114431654 [Parambassis ranga]|uniref:Uncharacterized protein LOC114431654 n=1 Tax=Parambassis ranga TaxID=210632 RepID=A0A6P7HHD4_9TELE|nr:uncharacterized protein LOC114431654 [Parambassis ranga]
MDLLWMILLLVLIRADAQRVTEVRGEEGGSLTLTCSITPTITDIYWFMEVYRGFRAGIGRTLGPHSSSYYSPDSESKYLMESNRLVVKDLTAEDSRLYSCGRRNQSGLHFVDSFNLTLGKTSGGSAHSQHPSCMTPQDLTYVSSSIMAALAAIVVCQLHVEGHVIINGEEQKQSQDQRFRGRVSSFPKEYQNGNFSIILRNLSMEDSGPYECHISSDFGFEGGRLM